TTQPGVTVDGNGFAMLDVSSTVHLKDLHFTDGTVTVEGDGALNVESNFDVGVASRVNNYGSVDVCGDFLGGGPTAGCNYGAADFHTDHDFALGTNGSVSNGVSDADAAVLTVGGDFRIGNDDAGPSDFGTVFNYGTSSISVAGDFAIHGDGGSFVYNGR